jgi:hypothetical protein
MATAAIKKFGKGLAELRAHLEIVPSSIIVMGECDGTLSLANEVLGEDVVAELIIVSLSSVSGGASGKHAKQRSARIGCYPGHGLWRSGTRKDRGSV